MQSNRGWNSSIFLCRDLPRIRFRINFVLVRCREGIFISIFTVFLWSSLASVRRNIQMLIQHCLCFCFSLQMTLLPDNFSLHFHPTLSTDTAEYICLVNDRHSPEAIIDLLVHGKRIFVIFLVEMLSEICLLLLEHSSEPGIALNAIRVFFC